MRTPPKRHPLRDTILAVLRDHGGEMPVDAIEDETVKRRLAAGCDIDRRNIKKTLKRAMELGEVISPRQGTWRAARAG